MNNKRRILLPIILIITFGFFYFTGYLHGHDNLKFYKGYIPQIQNKELGKPKDIDFSLFWDVWNKVEEKYPGEINRKKIFYGAISGILNGLDDPYSVFMEPGVSRNFLEDLKGVIEGIGVEITIKNNHLTVVAPLENSRAQKAGLKAGDIITKIDGIDTSTMSLEEAVSKIRGREGTRVKLTILRDSETFEKELVREKIKIESVKYEIQNEIAIIKISQFGNDTEESLNKAIADIQIKKPKGIILDLRDNPGGYLETSVNVASVFIKEGVIVSEEYKGGKKDEFKSSGDGRLKDLKLVVLINEGSASASEIVAGAVQDYKRGIIIGEKTFGKGSVQDLESLKDGAYLRLTVAKWLTPNGRYINGQGIKPDIEVKLDQTDIDKGIDPQMERAIEEINK